MSQQSHQSLPSTIHAASAPTTPRQSSRTAGDDLSMLTPAEEEEVIDSIEHWLTPHSNMAKFFVLTKPNTRKTAPVWKFFHLVEGLKDDGAVTDDVPSIKKWFERPVPGLYACCNSCGAFVVCATTKGNSKTKFKNYSNGSLTSHLMTRAHGEHVLPRAKRSPYRRTDRNPKRTTGNAYASAKQSQGKSVGVSKALLTPTLAVPITRN